MKKLLKNVKVINEFGSDITKIVDVYDNNGQVMVVDEFGIDITKIVDVVKC